MSKKGENIYKRKDNRWEARYIKGYKPDGSAKYGYCYAKTYREARQKLAKAKSALITGAPLPSTSLRRRFGYYCDEWLALKRNRVKESTYVKYLTVIEKHIKPALGDCLTEAISTFTAEQFRSELLNKSELKSKTVKDILTVLRSVINYAAEQLPGIMPKIDIVFPKEARKEIRVLSRDEQDFFIKYLLNDTDECKFGVLLALLTGLRIGEVCALRWENISLKERIINVSSTMQRLKNLDKDSKKKTKIVITEPKSVMSERKIPLNEYAVKLCKSKTSGNPKAFVLTGEPDRYIEPRTLQNRLEHYTRDCNLQGVHFHVLRHTFATRCVEVGFEIKSLSEILGHSSPRITLERYVHSSMELKRENMDKLSVIGY